MIKNFDKKAKALFQILIVISASFSVFLLSSNDAAAQATDEQKVCCSSTVSGEYCSYAPKSQCRAGATQAATTCDKTSFCKLGCGFDQGSGKCFKNLPKFSCERSGNCTWVESPTCEAPQCQRGCCVLSNQCSFLTQLECKRTTSQFEFVNMTFKQEITDELSCINQCRSFERGACVSSDGSCKFVTRDNCAVTAPATLNVTGPKVGFYPDRLCSNPQLGTECAPQQYTGCVPDREEVYWFDSCGNPENIYSNDKIRSYHGGFILSKAESCNPGSNNINSPSCGNCDYVRGTACAPAERNVRPAFGQFACKDLSCGLDDITRSPTSPASNAAKKLGESWCAYDGVPGFGRDLVGSRHYRRLCINGQEFTEPCKDYREELCVQGVQGQPPFPTQQAFQVKQGNYVEAACRGNRAVGCIDIKNQFDCENLQQRDCVWFGESKRSETEARRNTLGKCVPLVKIGLKFWPDESAGQTPTVDAKATCEKGNQECKVTFQRSGLSSKWECVSNCDCLKKDYLKSVNNVCKALGDCGAWYNIAGKFTTGGLEENSKFDLLASDVEGFDELIKPVKGKSDYDSKFGAFFERSWIPLGTLGVIGLGSAVFGGTIYAGFSALSAFGPIFHGSNIGGAFLASSAKNFGIDVAKNTFGTLVPNDLISGQSLDTLAKAMGGKVEGLIANGYANPVGDGFVQLTPKGIGAIKDLGLSKVPVEAIPWEQSLLATLGTVLTIASILWTVYNILDILLAKTKTEKINVKCLPWTAPVGGSDCEKCQAEGKECSEYRCKSLGQICALVNPGTKQEKCIDQHPNDVTSPIIRADPTAFSRGITFTEAPGEGFTINQLIEPFTPVSLGIMTNEYSQCKYGLERGKTFEEMPAFFGDNLYAKNHTMKFSLPSELAKEEVLKLTNGGKYTIYARCQDGKGNKNNRDYYIKFGIKPGPDLTPPVIELTSIANNAYVPAYANETLFVAYVNEPSTCKWDFVDTDYDKMQRDFSCTSASDPSSSEYYGLYSCATALTGIRSNNVNTYYFRCRDQPLAEASKRNTNSDSYIFRLRGTVPLEITSVSPVTGSELFDADALLKVITAKGAQGGNALCGYNFENPEPVNAIDFLRTNSTVHEQPFANLTSGNYNAHINCIDVAGNIASETTSFRVSVDTNLPTLNQLYTEGTLLVIVTSEPTTCEYSTTGAFTYGSGIQMTGTNVEKHEATLDSNIYYITCADSFNNKGSYVVYV